MKKNLLFIVLIMTSIVLFSFTKSNNTKVSESFMIPIECTFKSKKLFGKIQFVTSHPDIKIQYVDAGADIDVQMVTSSATSCGKWQEVKSSPDLKVQVVNSFPDLKVRLVKSNPGMK